MRRTKLEETESFDGIRKIKENFSAVLARNTSEIRNQFSQKINVLKQEELSLLDKIQESEMPLKKEQKRIRKIQKSSRKLDKKQKKNIRKKVSHLNKAKNIIDKNISFYQGSIGEEAVIETLSELSDSYYILNDVRLRLPRSVRWKKYNEYVRSSQVDHIVVGPKGIFLIETKNWTPQTLQQTRRLPHYQIDRANFIFYILRINKFRRKFPIYNIVVTLRNLPIVNYQYVKQLSVKELNSHISTRQGFLSESEINQVVNWLKRFI